MNTCKLGKLCHTAPPFLLLPPLTPYKPNPPSTLSTFISNPNNCYKSRKGPRLIHLTSSQIHLAHRDPRTPEFMPIENLKTFGESDPLFGVRPRAHSLTLSSSLCSKDERSHTSCCYTLNLQSSLSLKIISDSRRPYYNADPYAKADEDTGETKQS